MMMVQNPWEITENEWMSYFGLFPLNNERIIYLFFVSPLFAFVYLLTEFFN